jgi:hypothetical protein
MKNLKKIIITAIITIATIFYANAQTTFTTNEVRQYMSKGEQNGIEIILKGANIENTREELKKWSKKIKAKFVYNKKSPEIFIDDAQINTVSANTVDIYAILVPIENGTKLTLFTDLGGAFITSYAYGAQYAAMDAQIKEFAQNLALRNTAAQLKSEEKQLKTLKKELDKLVKDKEKAIKEIEKAKALIQEKEALIQKNDAEQAAKQQQISLQQQIIETVKTKKASLNY